MRFEFATVDRIIFGRGTVKEVPDLAARAGRRALIVTGRSRQRARFLGDLLEDKRLAVSWVSVAGEPTPDTVAEGVRVAREAECDVVIGMGGGSVLDAAKIISAMLTNDGALMDYLEVIGNGRPLTHRAAPYIAVPTTAGTGAEVTRNAVIGSPEHRVKVSMRHALMLPRYAVIDPELTFDLLRDITAASGLDALTQLMEVFVSDNSSPLTDAVCREGLCRARSLRDAWEDGHNGKARADICLAALCSGLALANARLGAVHGLAGPLGGMFPAPHGAVCARLLPFVMDTNLAALQARDRENRAIERYNEIAQILTGNSSATAQAGMDWVQALCDTLAVPGLNTYGICREEFTDIIAKSRESSSMKGNPIKLTDDELANVLEGAL